MTYPDDTRPEAQPEPLGREDHYKEADQALRDLASLAKRYEAGDFLGSGINIDELARFLLERAKVHAMLAAVPLENTWGRHR